MAWWNRRNPVLFAQDAQWVEVRRAIDRANSSHWPRAHENRAARAARQAIDSQRLRPDSRESLRGGRRENPPEATG